MVAPTTPIPDSQPQTMMSGSPGITSPAAMEPDASPVTLDIPAELVGPLKDLLSTLPPEDPLQALLPMLDSPDAGSDPLAGLGASIDSMRGAV